MVFGIMIVVNLSSFLLYMSLPMHWIKVNIDMAVLDYSRVSMRTLTSTWLLNWTTMESRVIQINGYEAS